MFELYTVLADGVSNVRVNGALVADGDVQTVFLWSPDSSRLVYRADQDTDLADELYIVFADGTGNVKLNGPLVAGGNVSGGFQWGP